MLPLLVKDGLLLPYVVTSLAFLFLSLYLLSALERSTDEELRLGLFHKLTQHCLPKLNLSQIIKWKVSYRWRHGPLLHTTDVNEIDAYEEVS